MPFSIEERRARRAANAKKYLHTQAVHQKLKKPKTAEHKKKLSESVKAALAKKRAKK